ncbi:MAG: hypothetical protein RSA71_03410 [Eubacterium sp.]
MKKEYTWWLASDVNTEDHGIFGSIEDCVEDIKNREKTLTDDYVLIGELIPFTVDSKDLVETIIESLQDDATCFAGESGEDWLTDLSDDAKNDLEVMVGKIIHHWIEKYEYQPNFYSLEIIQEIAIR